jgi:pyruvate formate lyase activating enzyme
MIIGGLQKFSLLDYPDQVAAIIFTQGCNFRCQFCYNPMLVWPVAVGKFKNTSINFEESKKGQTLISEADLFYFLDQRKNKLDAVVITGGEPTIHSDLPDFIRRLKNLGFKVKLDTNGTNPAMLAKLIKNKLLDYVAMDIKAPAKKYLEAVGLKIHPVKSAARNPDSSGLFNRVKKSVKILKASGLPYEFRSTIVPGLHNEADIKKIGELVAGADKWYLQFFKNDTNLLNPDFQQVQPYTEKQMEKMRLIGSQYVKHCFIR